MIIFASMFPFISPARFITLTCFACPKHKVPSFAKLGHEQQQIILSALKAPCFLFWLGKTGEHFQFFWLFFLETESAIYIYMYIVFLQFLLFFPLFFQLKLVPLGSPCFF